MGMSNAPLMRGIEGGGYRSRMDRRILSGRVVGCDETTRTVLVDVGAEDALQTAILYRVPYNPQNPPQVNDIVALTYGNSSPHSAVVGALSVGGANAEQVIRNGGVSSIASDSDPKIKDDVRFVSGAGISISQSGQDLTIAATGNTPATTVTDVASSGVVGTSTNFAREDHAHRGVQSVAKSGSAEITGDATFTGTGGIALNQSGNNIEIDGSGIGGTSYAPTWTTYTLAYNTGGNGDLLPSNQRNYNLFTCAAKQLIHAMAYDVTTAFSGGSISAATLTGLDLFSGFSINIFTGATEGISNPDGSTEDVYIGKYASLQSGTQVQRMRVTVTGGNIVDLTAGQVTVWVLSSLLPP